MAASPDPNRSTTPQATPPDRPRRPGRADGTLVLCAVLLLLTGTSCGYGSQRDRSTETRSAAASEAQPHTSASQVRFGLFATLTHASPLVALDRGYLSQRLGTGVPKPRVFTDGPAEVEALNSGAIDMAWIGPSPAINGYLRSHGKALRVVAGATSGGASLVVNPKRIHDAGDLAGHRLASPQLGNTQDIALRSWLRRHGHPVDRTGRGDVTVQSTSNAEALRAFQRGDIDGAWVPEPWASRMVLEAGGTVLVDERSLWPHRRFASTVLVASTGFLNDHPDTVRSVIRAQRDSHAWMRHHPAQARRALNHQLAIRAGASLNSTVLTRAYGRLSATDDPLPATLRTQVRHAIREGLAGDVDVPQEPKLRGLYALGPLNAVLRHSGHAAVDLPAATRTEGAPR